MESTGKPDQLVRTDGENTQAQHALRHIRNTFAVPREILKETEDNIEWLIKKSVRDARLEIVQRVWKKAAEHPEGPTKMLTAILREIEDIEWES